jgi:hypothetical protein
MGAFDGGIGLRAATEVIGGNDEVFQFAERAGRLAHAAMMICPLSPTPCKA